MQPQPHVRGVRRRGGQVGDRPRAAPPGVRRARRRRPASAVSSAGAVAPSGRLPSAGAGNQTSRTVPAASSVARPKPQAEEVTRSTLRKARSGRPICGRGPGHWPVRPSMHSRSRSAWPQCRAYSSIMCTTSRAPRPCRRRPSRARRGPVRCRARRRACGDLARATRHASSTTAGSATAPLKSAVPVVLVLEEPRRGPSWPSITRRNQRVLDPRQVPDQAEQRHRRRRHRPACRAARRRAPRTSARGWRGSARGTPRGRRRSPSVVRGSSSVRGSLGPGASHMSSEPGRSWRPDNRVGAPRKPDSRARRVRRRTLGPQAFEPSSAASLRKNGAAPAGLSRTGRVGPSQP